MDETVAKAGSRVDAEAVDEPKIVPALSAAGGEPAHDLVEVPLHAAREEVRRRRSREGRDPHRRVSSRAAATIASISGIRVSQP